MADGDNRKILGVFVECAKMTPEIFAKAVSELANNTNKQSVGRTSLKKLETKGKLENIQVNDSNIGSFVKTARKYNLTYALKRTQNEDGKNLYLVCFQGKDLDTMQRAFKEYSYTQTHKKETLFSRKKIMDIDVSAHNKDMELGRDKQKQRKKERNTPERG